MIVVKSPFRVSLFGGSTDYESFYSHYGSFLIGGTIDKHVYQTIRFRNKLLPKESLIVYSKMECVNGYEGVTNPLIREVMRYKKVKDFIDFYSFSDIRSRTGLGGSSSFCVCMLFLINQLYDISISKRDLVEEAFNIERNILKEAGGMQDHIWPVYGGLNSIEINTDGEFLVKPLPVTEDFRKELESHLLLIYTGSQRGQEDIALSHEGKDKKVLLELAKKAYERILEEDIEGMGGLMFESWKEKSNISNLVSNKDVDAIIDYVMTCGAYGAKLLGAGGCGFILCVCNSKVKEVLIREFEGRILDFKFDLSGVTRIY